MFTERSLLKAKIDLYNISSNLAYEDYKRANFNRYGKRKSKKHIPYTLSDESLEVLEVYKMVHGKNPEDITAEQEEIIKGFLLSYRKVRREYLKEGYQGGSWYYKDKAEELGMSN